MFLPADERDPRLPHPQIAGQRKLQENQAEDTSEESNTCISSMLNTTLQKMIKPHFNCPIQLIYLPTHLRACATHIIAARRENSSSGC